MAGRIRIYHITHIDNLRSIVRSKGLFSNAEMHAWRGAYRSIGISSIKERRMQLPVSCHPGTTVGEYVPFYFCTRSVMLYVIHRTGDLGVNDPDLQYHGGQEPIIYLVANVYRVIEWARRHRIPWAISSTNAGAHHAEFRNDIDALHELDWEAIHSPRWIADPEFKEARQAEFLVYRAVHFGLFERIGVLTERRESEVQRILRATGYRIPVEVRPEWYFAHPE